LRLLLDTHTLLWWLTENSSLSPRAQGLLENKANTVLVSAATAWEMATKVRLGRLDVATEVVQNFLWYVERERFQAIAVTLEHGVRAGSLPGPHKDPFDRMLIAQAITENIPIVSNDRAFDGYGIDRLW